MIRLIKLSLYKLVFYRSFWWILAIYLGIFLLIIGGIYGLGKIPIGEAELPINGFFVRPYVWQNLCTFARLGNYFLSLVVILVITNDFQYRLLRQKVINGLSREEGFLTYLFIAFAMSILSLLLVCGLGLLFSKAGESFFDLQALKVFGSFIEQSMGFFTFAILLAVIFKFSAVTIMAFLAWHLVLEHILAYIFNKYIFEGSSQYLPFRMLNELVPPPIVEGVFNTSHTFELRTILVSSGYIGIFSLLTWARLKFSDL